MNVLSAISFYFLHFRLLLFPKAAALLDQRIIVAIDSWPRNSLYPLGHFVRKLGPIGDKDTENEVLLLEHDVPHGEFIRFFWGICLCLIWWWHLGFPNCNSVVKIFPCWNILKMNIDDRRKTSPRSRYYLFFSPKPHSPPRFWNVCRLYRGRSPTRCC